MSFGDVLHHAGLVLAVAALGAAGLRAASAWVPRGLERLLAALVLAAATAAAEGLGLGLAGAGGDSVALVAAAVATWVAAARLAPPPAVAPLTELRGWWGGLGRPRAALCGAVAGVWAAWAAWLLANPALGHDMILYHLPEAIGWVHNGRPGSLVAVVEPLPVANYPVTHEVLLAWGMAIARSFVWVTLVTAAIPAIAAAAAWSGLRTLGVDRATAGLGAAALVATPAVVASQSGGASVDPAALAWLTACAALAAAAAARPGALVPAVVAAGLAVGTKTTALPLALVVLVGLGLIGAGAVFRLSTKGWSKQ
jgi:hypothetical protein